MSSKTSGQPNHDAFAVSLKRCVVDGPGQSGAALRKAVAARAAGGPPIENPYDDLARQIGEAAYGTTDSQVNDVLVAAGSEKAAFELIAAAATGAGLRRWERALDVLTGVDDATA